jgi:hypothetical protein
MNPWAIVAGLAVGAALGVTTAHLAAQPPLDKSGQPVTIGRFRLRTFPKGARVWIDGVQKVESTPATLILEQGEYHLFIQAPGAEGVERVITVEAGESKSLDLRIPPPSPASITVLSDVDAAEVRINGYKRGVTPMLYAVTKPGAIDMTVTDPAGRAKSVRTVLEIGEKQWHEVFFDDALSKAPEPPEVSNPLQCHPREVGFLTIALEPKGTVEDDKGEKLGETPLFDKEIEPGIHNLILRSKDGKFQRSVSIEVQANERGTYRFMFTPEDEIR